nr:MAG: hypothetical protein DIU62_12345 [Pseudomonadota bacterium]
MPVAATPAERRAAVDARLQASLDRFDAELRKEQEQVARQRDARAGNAGSATGENVLDRYGSEDSDRALARNRAGDLRSEGVGRGSEGEGPGQSSGGSGTGASGGTGSGVIAREIPAGDDDDIIARRLRKAAEEETDPELKEKLWKEYIDYKENTQKKGG